MNYGVFDKSTLGDFTGISVIASSHVNDWDNVKRTWKERLLTRPWRPWVSHKSVYNPKFYIVENKIICSMRSERDLAEQIKRKPEEAK